jgi:hypothetical protein
MDRFEPKHTLFDSIEEMLSPVVLSDLLQRKISEVTCQPFKSVHGWSGNLLYQVHTDSVQLFVKRLRPSIDWLSIGSEDQHCRSVRVWQYGLLDRLQPHVEHMTLAACQDGEGYALLMHDISRGMLTDQHLPRPVIHTLLDAIAAIHATYWEDERLTDPALGLAAAEKLVTFDWPQNWHLFRQTPEILEIIAKGWNALFDMLEPDVCAALQAVMDNPQPLFEKLAQFPRTLIHADFRIANVALLPENHQVVAFDWQNAAFAPATICSCWFTMSGEVFSMQTEAAEYYRQQLSHRLGNKFDQSLWQPMLDVGNLIEVLRKGSWHAMSATTSPDETLRARMRQCVKDYNDLVRKGILWL